jgi:hypothetical protein
MSSVSWRRVKAQLSLLIPFLLRMANSMAGVTKLRSGTVEGYPLANGSVLCDWLCSYTSQLQREDQAVEIWLQSLLWLLLVLCLKARLSYY